MNWKKGYWMPFECAKAVCATFCQRIAGALIPIFGPDFPSLCTPADTPEYSRMVIDPAIVQHAAREASEFRRMYSNSGPAAMDASSSTAAGVGVGVGVGLGRDRIRDRDPDWDRDRDRRVILRDPYEDGRRHQLQLQLHRQQQQRQPPYSRPQLHPHQQPPHPFQVPRHYYPRLRKSFMEQQQPDESPYPGTDTEGETSPTTTDRSSGAGERYIYSPAPSTGTSSASVIPSFRTHSGWTPANMLPHYEATGPSPWLSAVPRLPGTSGVATVAGGLITSPHPRAFPHPIHPAPAPPRLPRIYPSHSLEAATSASASASAAAAAAAAAMATTSISTKTTYPSPHKYSLWRGAIPAAAPGPGPGPGCKRSADHVVGSDYERERVQGEDEEVRREATAGSRATTRSTSTAAASPAALPVGQRFPPPHRHQKLDSRHDHGHGLPSGGGGGTADKNAALLLMNLSFRDSVGSSGGLATSPALEGGERSIPARRGGADGADGGCDDVDAGTAASSATSSPRGCAGDGSFRRAKRIRSSSM